MSGFRRSIGIVRCFTPCSHNYESFQKNSVKCSDGLLYAKDDACAGQIESCQYNCTGGCDEAHAFTCSDGKCIPRFKVKFSINLGYFYVIA